MNGSLGLIYLSMVIFKSNFIILRHNTSLKTQNIPFNPKNASKITTSKNVCLLVNISKEANSVDPDQFVKETSNISADDKSIWLFREMRFKLNKSEFSVYMVRIFMKCMHVTIYFSLYQL